MNLTKNKKNSKKNNCNFEPSWQLSLTKDQIRKLIENEKEDIKILGEWYIKYHQEQSEISGKIQKYKEENPNLSIEEIIPKFIKMGELSMKESLDHYTAAIKIGTFINFLGKNKDKISEEKFQSFKLYKDVNEDYNFAIANIVSDAIYHLVELIEIHELSNTFGNNWIAIGKMTDSKGLTASLEYEFKASSHTDAEKQLHEYKKIMATKGIKVWMGYWKVANQKGIQYTCSFIEPLKQISDKSRESYFSTKEKQEQWNITKLLKNTRIKVQRYVKTTKAGNRITRWVEQPLVEILGGEKEEKSIDKYPINITVRVLSPQATTKDFAPLFYDNEMLHLHPNTSLLAYVVSTRMARKQDDTLFNWESLFKLGNVQNTTKTNKREAKIKIKKKMDEMTKHKIIGGYTPQKQGIYILNTKKVKKNKTKKNI